MASSTNKDDLMNSPEVWDFIHGANSESPTISLDFEGDKYTWGQLIAKANKMGLNPDEVTRYALYLLLEGGQAAARARLLAYKEWERTRAVWISDEKGARWVGADRVPYELRRE